MLDKLKIKYDKIFDDIFFSKEFIDFIVSKFGYCPNGLTFDTYASPDKPIEFICRCKQYGYDYSGERVIGDYQIIKTKINLEEYAYEMLKYLRDNYQSIYDEISEYDVYCD